MDNQWGEWGQCKVWNVLFITPFTSNHCPNTLGRSYTSHPVTQFKGDAGGGVLAVDVTKKCMGVYICHSMASSGGEVEYGPFLTLPRLNIQHGAKVHQNRAQGLQNAL
jgi:hypothetical protein